MPTRQIMTIIGLIAVLLYFILDTQKAREILAGREVWFKRILLAIATICLVYSVYLFLSTGGS